MADLECWKLLVLGRVQGIGYRISARSEARRLGLNGLVRNLRDGSVEVIAEGAPAALSQMERWCRRGPPLADVTDLTVERLSDPRGFLDFNIG